VPGFDVLDDVSLTTIALGVAVLVVVVWLLTREPAGGGDETTDADPDGTDENSESEHSDEVASAFNYDE
jgi:hypothetical protein